MRVLILGGTAFIGPWVVRSLVELGHEVVVFHRGETECSLPDEVEHVHGDFTEFERHVSELRAARPDAVVDMRAFRADEGRRVHAFKGVAERAVVCSSLDVYRAFGRLWRTEPGPPDPIPLNEESPLRDRVIDEAYDKVGVERIARSDPSFPVTIVRLPATHGPGDPHHRLFEYVKRMDDGRPALVLSEHVAGWRWARGYVEDVGRAVALGAVEKSAAGKTFNVAEEVAYTETEWVRKIAGITGWRGEIVAVPPDFLPEAMRMDEFDLRQDYVVDSARIRHELGFAERVPEDDALRRTVDWERRNPPAGWEENLDYAAEDAALAKADALMSRP